MAEPQPPARRENVLTRKLGPLPTWVWVVIAAAIVIGLAWVKTSRSQKSKGSGSAAGSAQVPQFVNQTYTTIEPPESERPEDDDDKHRRHHKGKHPRRFTPGEGPELPGQGDGHGTREGTPMYPPPVFPSPAGGYSRG